MTHLRDDSDDGGDDDDGLMIVMVVWVVLLCNSTGENFSAEMTVCDNISQTILYAWWITC